MPLPAALAAKLAKRGLLQQKHRSGPTGNSSRQTILPPSSAFPQGYVEEVIAESYDDDDVIKAPASKISKFLRLGHAGCPNKYNLYHTCCQYCITRWGKGRPSAGSRYNQHRTKMLKKYPLPPGWQEVYDAGCGRHYYWNLKTDAVSWVSPTHPKAVITRPVAELRAKFLELGTAAEVPPPPGLFKGGKQAERRKNRERERGGKRKQADDLDPMDPAAYSDVPRGDWSSGLEKSEVDGKTGADVTASGPLFQSRPYPNPGAILRANAAAADPNKPRKR